MHTVEKQHIFSAAALMPLQEALPTPFGLVRSGVAPDHADTKVGS